MDEATFFAQNPRPWYWLSFADPSAPPGKQFLGVVVVHTHGRSHLEAFSNAMKRAWALDINPGGEVRGIPVPIETIPEDCRNRLLSKEELQSRDLGVR